MFGDREPVEKPYLTLSKFICANCSTGKVNKCTKSCVQNAPHVINVLHDTRNKKDLWEARYNEKMMSLQI